MKLWKLRLTFSRTVFLLFWLSVLGAALFAGLTGCASTPAPRPYAVAVWKVPEKSEKLNDISKAKKPTFVTPATPGASSCLIPSQEQVLLDLLAKLAGNDAAWRAWYDKLKEGESNGSNPGY